MDPVRELKKALAPSLPTSGTVISILKDVVLVGTKSGTKRFTLGTATKIVAGDYVALRNGMVVGKLKSDDEIKHVVV